MKRKRHILRRLFGVVLLLPLLLLILVHTPPGRRMLSEQVARMLSEPGVREVEIRGVEGWIPWDMYVEHISVADANGVWLTTESLALRWTPVKLMQKRVRIRHVRAASVTLIRRPESKEPVALRNRLELSSWELILNDLQVDQLQLGDAIVGVPLNYSVASGDLHLSANGRLSGVMQVSGDARGRVALNTPGSPGPRLVLEAELEELSNPKFGLDAVSGKARFAWSGHDVSGQVSVDIRKDQRQGHLVSALNYGDRQLVFDDIEFSGAGLSAAGRVSAMFGTNEVGVSLNLNVTDPQTHVYTVQGDAVLNTEEAWSVKLDEIQLQAQSFPPLRLSGSITQERMDLEGRVEPFDIRRLPGIRSSRLNGRVQAMMKMEGPLEKPELSGMFEMEGLSGSAELVKDLPTLDLLVDVDMSDGQLSALTRITNAVTGSLEASMTMPCTFSLRPLAFDPAPEAVEGRLNADWDLSVLNQLYWMADQRITGQLKADLSYAEGTPSGTLSILNGSYEHYGFGIVMLDLFMQLKAVHDGFVVERGQATDGENGSMKFSGGLHGGELDLQAAFKEARMLRRAEASAWLSGALQVAGPVARPTLSGSMTVDRCEILVDQFIGSRPPVLKDFSLESSTNKVRQAKSVKALPFGVDVVLYFSDQIYINASLIDSVWGGQMRLSDGGPGLMVDGRIEPRRGFINFIGKKFRFVEGAVLFDGVMPPEIVFDNLTAEYSRGDITARLVLNGRLSNPQYRLESIPAMPRDEILSHVLFNRELSSISAYQALQIASAARQLQGGLQGPGFMYQFRQAIGIDTLEWREEISEGDGGSLAAGKYLTSSLYFEVNTGIDSEGRAGMSAEYEVSRHFSIETSTGPQMRPGVSINWKYDY